MLLLFLSLLLHLPGQHDQKDHGRRGLGPATSRAERREDRAIARQLDRRQAAAAGPNFNRRYNPTRTQLARANRAEAWRVGRGERVRSAAKNYATAMVFGPTGTPVRGVWNKAVLNPGSPARRAVTKMRTSMTKTRTVSKPQQPNLPARARRQTTRRR